MTTSHGSKDYLDLLVLIEEFGLPANLTNDGFTGFEIQGRQSEIRIDYKAPGEKYIPPDYSNHPLYKGIHQTMQGYYVTFWMSLEHKEEDLHIRQTIHDTFALPD